MEMTKAYTQRRRKKEKENKMLAFTILYRMYCE